MLHGIDAFFTVQKLCCQHCATGKAFTIIGGMDDFNIING